MRDRSLQELGGDLEPSEANTTRETTFPLRKGANNLGSTSLCLASALIGTLSGSVPLGKSVNLSESFFSHQYNKAMIKFTSFSVKVK